MSSSSKKIDFGGFVQKKTRPLGDVLKWGSFKGYSTTWRSLQRLLSTGELERIFYQKEDLEGEKKIFRERRPLLGSRMRR